ncbi:sigma factor-like helix-turn-helix DNA-binding protein [Sphingopyxis kveilinensis]|uniref:sigma factor-like helix-turn-helix DNA-binding protein n=1 Tax=Sphingopyxis kveilinensis TaxID=3114367 RepID=UPI0030D06482
MNRIGAAMRFRKPRAISSLDAAEIERRLAIALGKMTARQADIFVGVRFDETPYEELAARHGISVDQVTADFARALRMWSRCLHARFPSLVWPWL